VRYDDRYKMLKAALPAGAVLSEVQERYLVWLSGWDDETAEVVASIFTPAAERKTVEELVKALAEFVGREHGNATEPWSGLSPLYVVGVDDLLDELHRLTGVNKEQLDQWSRAAAEAVGK
jgi:hypothetical protein